MFYDEFLKLCRNKGVSIPQASSDIGISRTTVSKWRERGSTPHTDVIIRIAEYFDVSVAELVGEDKARGIVTQGEQKQDGDFYDRFIELCGKIGKSPTSVALDIGLSKSTPTRWKKTGCIPNGETLKKIADYFGMTVSELLRETDEKEKPLPYVEGAEEERMIREIMSLDKEDYRRVLDFVAGLKAARKA